MKYHAHFRAPKEASMSSSHLRSIKMERAATKIIKTLLKIANLILLIVGMSMLMYSSWMLIVVLRKYRKYFFASWFLWATIASGLIFCFTACIGYVGAITRSKIFLPCHLVCVFLLLLVEILVVGDVSLNDNWKKDFPKDPAHRFEDFVDFVDSNRSTFKFLMFLTFLVQIASFGLAMALGLTESKSRPHLNIDANQISAHLPFLAHQVGPGGPCVMGHPFPTAHENVPPESKANSGVERDVWSMCPYACPPFYV